MNQLKNTNQTEEVNHYFGLCKVLKINILNGFEELLT